MFVVKWATVNTVLLNGGQSEKVFVCCLIKLFWIPFLMLDVRKLPVLWKLTQLMSGIADVEWEFPGYLNTVCSTNWKHKLHIKQKHVRISTTDSPQWFYRFCNIPVASPCTSIAGLSKGLTAQPECRPRKSGSPSMKNCHAWPQSPGKFIISCVSLCIVMTFQWQSLLLINIIVIIIIKLYWYSIFSTWIHSHSWHEAVANSWSGRAHTKDTAESQTLRYQV